MAMDSGCDDYQCPCHKQLARVYQQLATPEQIPIRCKTERGWEFVKLTDLPAEQAIEHIRNWLEPQKD